MAKLHFSLEGNSLGEYALNKERTTIGRRPANDIHIDNLAVSGDHAVIMTIGNDSFLEDLNSTNGTVVNTKSVKKHVLHHNDIIEFGKYQLRYENKLQEKLPVDRNGFENTVVLRPAKLNVATPEVAVAIMATPAAPEVGTSMDAVASDSVTLFPSPIDQAVVKQAPLEETPLDEAPQESTESANKMGHLQVLSGANSGRELLLNKALTTLGRPGVQVAVITKRPHGYFITHVEGEKLPLVNGLVIGAQAHALADRDVIDLTGAKMEFFLA